MWEFTYSKDEELCVENTGRGTDCSRSKLEFGFGFGFLILILVLILDSDLNLDLYFKISMFDKNLNSPM